MRAAIHVDDPPAGPAITADADGDGLEPPALTPRAFLDVVERIP